MRSIEEHLISLLDSAQRTSMAEQQNLISNKFQNERRQTVHMFVDNSNISIGAQLLPTGLRDFSKRLNIARFTQVVANGRRIARQVVCGSKPPRTSAIWQHWDRNGYQVMVEWRSPEDNREQFVDGRLVAEALMHVNSVGNANPDNVLVVCTGDGNTDNQAAGTTGANFQNLVRTVARMGWKVAVMVVMVVMLMWMVLCLVV
ncbi:unnamed protein product [Symbiodinium natans]|uniref:PIN domain-containing protein n=1 Tax=Symbiodinium natans TaxID=878477 RepID=A0A812JZQ5_9DINO|nr:unnamed protein product [Symbiodinium natans]